jgi:hypothetical protein
MDQNRCTKSLSEAVKFLFSYMANVKTIKFRKTPKEITLKLPKDLIKYICLFLGNYEQVKLLDDEMVQINQFGFRINPSLNDVLPSCMVNVKKLNQYRYECNGLKICDFSDERDSGINWASLSTNPIHIGDVKSQQYEYEYECNGFKICEYSDERDSEIHSYPLLSSVYDSVKKLKPHQRGIIYELKINISLFNFLMNMFN